MNDVPSRYIWTHCIRCTFSKKHLCIESENQLLVLFVSSFATWLLYCLGNDKVSTVYYGYTKSIMSIIHRYSISFIVLHSISLSILDIFFFLCFLWNNWETLEPYTMLVLQICYYFYFDGFSSRVIFYKRSFLLFL